jgi:uncharacterized membrane protein YfcA
MADPRLQLLVALAFVLESALGFGSSVMVATVGAAFGSLDAVMPAFITANLALSAWIVATAWRDIDGPLLLRGILPAVSAGLVVGLAFGRAADRPIARLAFGAGVVALSLSALRGGDGAARRPLPGTAATLLLALGGVVHGVFNAGGPLVVYVVSRRAPAKAAFRATLSALWLLLNLALIARWSLAGVWTVRTAAAALVLAPALAVGVALGGALFRRLPPRTFRAAAAAVMAAAGASLCARTLVAMLRA